MWCDVIIVCTICSTGSWEVYRLQIRCIYDWSVTSITDGSYCRPICVCMDCIFWLISNAMVLKIVGGADLPVPFSSRVCVIGFFRSLSGTWSGMGPVVSFLLGICFVYLPLLLPCGMMFYWFGCGLHDDYFGPHSPRGLPLSVKITKRHKNTII